MPLAPTPRIWLCGIGIFLGAVFVVAGAILPTVVETMIVSEVKGMIPVDQVAYGEKKWQDSYIDDRRYFTMYFYNITNLADVLTIGDKINVEEVGPYKYFWWKQKQNWEYVDGTNKYQFRYQEFDRFFTEEGDESDVIVQVNPIFMSNIQIAGTESAFYTYASTLVLQGLSQTLTTGKLIDALKIIGASSYLTTLSLQAPQMPTPWLLNDIIAQWNILNPWNSIEYTPIDIGIGMYAEPFEFNKVLNGTGISHVFDSEELECLWGVDNNDKCLAIPMVTDDFSILLPSDLSAGFASPKGIFLWLGAIMSMDTGCNFTVIQGGKCPLMPLLAQLQPDYVIAYIMALANEPWLFDSMFFGLKAGIVGCDQSEINTWADFGICQFAFSGVSRMFGADYMGDIMGIEVMSEQVRQPFELNYTLNLMYPGVNTSFNLTTTKEFLTYFSNIGSLSMFAAGMSMGFEFVEGLEGPELTALETAIKKYLLWWLPIHIFIEDSLWGDDNELYGTGSFGSGLFFDKTIEEFMWGWDDPFLLPPGMTFTGLYGPRFYSVEMWDAIPAIVNKGKHYHTIETGMDDYKNRDKYVEWHGIASLEVFNDMGWKPYPCTTYNPASPMEQPTGLHPNCLVWATPEVIEGFTGGNFITPFQENKDPISPYKVYAGPVYRKVDFVFLENTIFKGLHLRRYVIDEGMLALSSTNENYWMYECEGLAPLYSVAQAPLYISFPAYAGVDPNCITVDISGSEWDDTIIGTDGHRTYILYEPLTGMALSYRMRIMFSTKLTKLDGSSSGLTLTEYAGLWTPFDYCDTIHTNFALTEPCKWENIFNNNETIFIPLAWGEEEKDLRDEDADMFQTYIFDTRLIAEYTQYAGIPIGTVVLIASFIILLLNIRKPIEGTQVAPDTKKETA